MFLIDPIPYQNALAQAKAQLAEQRARIGQTEREENRLRDLLEPRPSASVSTTTRFRECHYACSPATGRSARARRGTQSVLYHVTAPVSGVSGRFQFSEGALVEANNSLLTTIVQLSPIWVRFSLSDNELAQLGGPLNEQRVQEDNADIAGRHGIRKERGIEFRRQSDRSPARDTAVARRHSTIAITACCRGNSCAHAS